MKTIMINGKEVPVTGESVDQAINSIIFKDWLASLNRLFVIKSIHFQSVDISPRTSRVKFIKAKIELIDCDGSKFTNIIFMRGGAVTILFVIHVDKEEFTILTRQPRLPSGSFRLLETPAGTIDTSETAVKVAVREIWEEVGIKIRENQLIDLTAHFHEKRHKGIYTSPGACDEFLRIFLCEITMTDGELEQLRGKLTGLRDEGERITLEVFRLRELPFEAPDAKSLAALALYDAYIREHST
ncbi:MAG: NUDIX domain-containing protein [Candidatus Paceibacterota bacterium]